MLSFRSRPYIPLGTYGPPLLQRQFGLSRDEARSHMHVIGVSGSGKSRFLAGLFIKLINNEDNATLIDPHGDLARLVLAQLVASGAYDQPAAYERIRYLDLPGAERAGRFLPFNVLA